MVGGVDEYDADCVMPLGTNENPGGAMIPAGIFGHPASVGMLIFNSAKTEAN